MTTCHHEKARVILVAYHCCRSEIDRKKFEEKEGVGIVSKSQRKQTPGWHHLTKGSRLTPPVMGHRYVAWRRYLYPQIHHFHLITREHQTKRRNVLQNPLRVLPKSGKVVRDGKGMRNGPNPEKPAEICRLKVT